MLYSGIDVGNNGAFVILDVEGEVVKVHKVMRVPKDDDSHKKWYDWFQSWATEMQKVDCVTIEKVRSSPQMGVVSAFTFGWQSGFASAIMCAARPEVPRYEVVPQEWKAAFNLILADKTKSVDKAKSLIAGIDNHLKYKKDHDIADAALIALYPLTKRGQSKLIKLS